MDSVILDKFAMFLEKERGFCASTIRFYNDALRILSQHDDLLSLREYSQVSNLIIKTGETRKGKYADSWSQNMRAKVASVCATFYNWLEREGTIPVNPMKNGHGFRKKRSPEANWIKEKDMPHVIFNPKYDFQTIVMLILLWDTGIRISELEALTIGDVNLEEGFVFIRSGKGGSSRRAVFTDECKNYLKMYFDMLKLHYDCSPEQPLFTNEAWQKPMKGTLQKQIFRICNRPTPKKPKGIKVNPHAFRHALAIRMLNKGVAPLLIQKQLGHANLSQLSTYTHATVADLRKHMYSAA
ncbi:MAG TPA: tyrosine-type recombinase/integrase [Verrucomicrobiae bacterium]|nr:tyrosine-type recombinase/integrase [Verrucomicrobiae bacterium]